MIVKRRPLPQGGRNNKRRIFSEAVGLRRGTRRIFEWQLELAPDADQRSGQRFDQLIIMKRRRPDAQQLAALVHDLR